MAKKILYVEDEGDHLLMLGFRLKSSGYEVIGAADGLEGLKKAREERPDLILMDWVMPKIDGMTACRALKKDPATQHIPILIITASVSAKLQQNCKDAGADDYLIKPFNPQDLLSKIKKLLSA